MCVLMMETALPILALTQYAHHVMIPLLLNIVMALLVLLTLPVHLVHVSILSVSHVPSSLQISVTNHHVHLTKTV
jgi:hypothetical protein